MLGLTGLRTFESTCEYKGNTISRLYFYSYAFVKVKVCVLR